MHCIQALIFFLFRIRDVWNGACELNGRKLNKNVLAEFTKRISKAKRGQGEKAKLDFSNCNIGDNDVSYIIPFANLYVSVLTRVVCIANCPIGNARCWSGHCQVGPTRK